MNARWISLVTLPGLLTATLLAMPVNTRLGAVHAATITNQVAPLQVAQSLKPFISEVAPAASPGKPAWIEIALSGPPEMRKVFVPLISRSGGGTMDTTVDASQAQPASSVAIASGTDLRRHVIDCEGFTYAIPDALPLVPPNGIIVIELGTPGPDDLDFSDGVATLHASTLPTTTFPIRGGSVALYSSTTKNAATIVDFVAWGSPKASAAKHAVLAGLWQTNAALAYDLGFGGEDAQKTPRAPNATFGKYAGEWASYRAANSSRGKLNPPPLPMSTFNPDGDVQDAATFSIGWSGMPGATAYELELATTADFAAPLVKITTLHTGWLPNTPLAAGAYFWRLQTVGQNGVHSVVSPPFQTTLTTPRAPLARKTLMTDAMYRMQRKDTTMLDIGGGNGNKPGSGSPRDHSDTRDRWDGPHVNNDTDKFPTFSWNGFDNLNCVRASVSMMTAFYGGTLSIDRISYYIFETIAPADDLDKGMPEGDLGFGEGASSSEPLQWALGGAKNESEVFCPDPQSDTDDEDFACGNDGTTSSTIPFATVRTMIDSGRPFILGTPGHAQVADGYLIDADGREWVHIFNPVPLGTDSCVPGQCTGVSWKYFATFKNKIVSYVIVKQGETITARSDEPNLKQDTDNDGINDFDEAYRFPTDGNKKDTDGDGVNDKADIAEYVFDAADKYFKRDADLSIWGISPNGGELYTDLDTLRKEADWDHDDDGIPDGCEDRDHDGRYGIKDPSTGATINTVDTNNFDPTSKQSCIPVLFISAPTAIKPAQVGTTLAPKPMLIELGAYVPDVMTPKPTYTPDQFTVKVGNKTATILSINKISDFIHQMRVQPPTQTVPGKYDVTVTFFMGGATNTQTVAVDYDPPPISP